MQFETIPAIQPQAKYRPCVLANQITLFSLPIKRHNDRGQTSRCTSPATQQASRKYRHAGLTNFRCQQKMIVPARAANETTMPAKTFSVLLYVCLVRRLGAASTAQDPASLRLEVHFFTFSGPLMNLYSVSSVDATPCTAVVPAVTAREAQLSSCASRVVRQDTLRNVLRIAVMRSRCGETRLTSDVALRPRPAEQTPSNRASSTRKASAT